MNDIMLDNLSVEKYGGKLHIDDGFATNKPVVIDVETDEKDNFVGMAMTDDGINIHYVTRLPSKLDGLLIGHAIKQDVKWLKQWGLDIRPEQIHYDTLLASYVQDPTKEKHGLKSLAKELLCIDYPSYREIVGKGQKRQTLDKHPVNLVANYCGLDVLSTFLLYRHFEDTLLPTQRRVLNYVEMPLLRLLYTMELDGIQLDKVKLREIEAEFRGELAALEDSAHKYFGKAFNLDSPKQLAPMLLSVGAKLNKTPKGAWSTDEESLLKNANLPIVKGLLRYSSLSTITATFVTGLLKRDTERLHTSFNQIINTGRLSSRDPNLQNIPSADKNPEYAVFGEKIRSCFIAKEGHTFIDADYDQIEYRLLAHFTQEPILLKAFREGKDVHQETANLLGVSRYLGKTLNFASIYGAHAKRIASTVNSSSTEKITEQDAERFLAEYWKRLPRVLIWVNRIKAEARREGVFKTLSGQFYKLKYIYDKDKYKRWFSERQAVNGTIQGSAAYIMKLAMLGFSSYPPVLQVHDELLFEVPISDIDDDHIGALRHIMENVVKLSVPLKVSIGVGKNWQEAKV